MNGISIENWLEFGFSEVRNDLFARELESCDGWRLCIGSTQQQRLGNHPEVSLNKHFFSMQFSDLCEAWNWWLVNY